MSEGDDFFAAARRFREREVNPPGCPWNHDSLYLFNLLEPALHLARFGCLGAEAFHEAHFTLYFLLLAGGGRLLDLQFLPAGNDVLVIVAAVLDGLTPGF